MTGSLTGASVVLCAAHKSPAGVLHGHTWLVTVWVPEGDCANELQRRVKAAARPLDHTLLPDTLSRGEQLARYFANMVDDAVMVEVDRPLERIKARWPA